jgi:septal ring factor EnvC (AmiA/AmiB activator)
MRRLPLLFLCCLALAGPASGASEDTRKIDQEIERLRKELVGLGQAEQSGEGAAERQRAQLIELNAREAAVKARIDANRGELAKLLGALQTYQRRPPPPLLVNPRSARDAVRAAILIRAVTPELQARGKTFAVQAEAIARLRRAAASASETLFQAESDIADHRADIDRLLSQKQMLEHSSRPPTIPRPAPWPPAPARWRSSWKAWPRPRGSRPPRRRPSWRPRSRAC